MSKVDKTKAVASTLLHGHLPGKDSSAKADANGDQRVASPSIEIPPRLIFENEHPKLPKTPKTPADEGIDFFESALVAGEAPIRVYELKLDPDGGPSKDRSVSVPVYHI